MHVPEINLNIETERLLIEPVQQHHAAHMIDILSHPDLYLYIPFDPPDLEKLTARYARWEPRISPDENEIWLNWVIRLRENNELIGDLQAGYKEDKIAYIAYLLGGEHQNRGYAYESVSALIAFLFKDIGITAIQSYIDTRNAKSIKLVQKLRFEQIDFIPNADHFKGTASDEFVFELVPEKWKKT